MVVLFCEGLSHCPMVAQNSNLECVQAFLVLKARKMTKDARHNSEDNSLLHVVRSTSQLVGNTLVIALIVMSCLLSLHYVSFVPTYDYMYMYYVHVWCCLLECVVSLSAPVFSDDVINERKSKQ